MSHYAIRTRASAALALLLLTACGSGTEPEVPGETATLTGTVRSATGMAPLEGATITLGTAQATSSASGQFELSGLPVGQATVRAERAGYVAAEATVTMAAGANSHDFSLADQEVYVSGAIAAYVPAGAGPIRAAIVIIGGPVASGFATGDPLVSNNPELEQSLQAMGAGLRALAKSEGVAIVGSRTTGPPNTAGVDTEIFGALTAIGGLSGHPELGAAPVLMFGLSAGAGEAAGLVSRHPERAVGLLVRVPAQVSALTTTPALAVPTLVMQAALDQTVNNLSIQTVFGKNRASGGRWALAVEPGVDHRTATSRANGAAVQWIREVLELRLPPSLGDPLIVLDESAGWLGDGTTLEISSWADYPGNRATASWLQSESAAGLWKALGTVEGGGE
ncbi:MAG TPA: carboxypeptidase-like regulatory domain-containing protein [Gemmatimonadales bacterium]|nr:carboxypeptidase-like regulatory domain-containing protein [Gemmatimonadales bacterium]